MKKHLLTLIIIMLCLITKAQDPVFTQFYANPLYLNPAFSGSNYCPRICMNYRNQWPNLSGTYVTYSTSFDRFIPAFEGGIGVLVTSDDQARGTLRTTSASFIYSYHIQVDRNFSIKAALQATYFQKNLDRGRLNFGDMIDARRGFVWNTNEIIPSQSKSNADFSTGIIAQGRNYFSGFAAHHITQPDEGLLGVSRLPARFTAHGGGNFELRERSREYLSPNILFQQQGKFMQLNLGLYYSKDAFVAGLWYRTGDAVIALVGLQNYHFKFGYSYDVTVSKLSGNTAGSHEISLQIRWGCKKPRPRYRLEVCPSF